MSYEVDAEFLDSLEYEVEDPRSFTSYSGRGMYGRYCLGFVGTIQDFSELVLTIAQIHDFDTAEKFTRVSTDSMGLSSVFYWPRITLTDDAKQWIEDHE